MKVTNDRPVQGPARKDGTRKSGEAGHSFSRLIARGEEAGETHAAGSAAPATGVDALLSLQEVSDGLSGRRRQAVKRGRTLIEHLEEIRIGLLTGRLSRERLIQLARILREPRAPDLDPTLAEALAEVELRAEVELAKLSKSL